LGVAESLGVLSFDLFGKQTKAFHRAFSEKACLDIMITQDDQDIFTLRRAYPEEYISHGLADVFWRHIALTSNI
jgi:hypothetical protein